MEYIVIVTPAPLTNTESFLGASASSRRFGPFENFEIAKNEAIYQQNVNIHATVAIVNSADISQQFMTVPHSRG